MYRLFLLNFIFILGCTAKKKEDSFTYQHERLTHASTFHFENQDGNEYVVVDEPWPNAKTVKKYKLNVPLKRVVCTSTTHLPYFELLGMENAIVGFPNTQYISSEAFNRKVEDGSILDLGSGSTLNLEVLIGLKPDAVIGFDIGGESSSLDKVEEAGIPVFYNADFLEKTPLGRAEWIKFFGALLGKEKEADSIFSKIENRYEELKKLSNDTREQPTILSGVVYGDTWYAPGGKNWFATFFNDAKGKYLWENDTTSGWLELSFESVYEVANETDYWVGVSTVSSMEELVGLDDRYAYFKAFKNNNVYNYNKKTGPNGGIDFFESGYARPDLVLADLIKILYPQTLTDHETIYFQKLE